MTIIGMLSGVVLLELLEDVLPQPYNVVKSDHTDRIKQNDNNLEGKNLHKRRNGDGKNDSESF
jgi:hypothetical protein